MIKILITVLLLSNIVAYGQIATQDAPDNKNTPIAIWNTLDLSTFAVKYPSSWELNQSGQMGSSFILFSALESDQDNFRENVNLIIQDLNGLNIDLNKFTEVSVGQINTMMTNSKLIESKRINNDIEYHKIIFTADQGVFNLFFQQHYMVIDNKAYVLTFTCDQAKLETFGKIGEEILNSFKIKK